MDTNPSNKSDLEYGAGYTAAATLSTTEMDLGSPISSHFMAGTGTAGGGNNGASPPASLPAAACEWGRRVANGHQEQQPARAGPHLPQINVRVPPRAPGVTPGRCDSRNTTMITDDDEEHDGSECVCCGDEQMLSSSSELARAWARYESTCVLLSEVPPIATYIALYSFRFKLQLVLANPFR